LLTEANESAVAERKVLTAQHEPVVLDATDFTGALPEAACCQLPLMKKLPTRNAGA
jgi:hypothetical protein